MTLVNLACAVSLPLMAFWYIFSWRFGMPALTVCVIAFVVIDVAAASIVNFESGDWVGAPGIPIARRLAEGPWYLQLGLFVIALAAYYGLMRAAVRVKEKCEACL